MIYLALAPKKTKVTWCHYDLAIPSSHHPFPSWPSPPSDTAVSGRSDGLAVGSLEAEAARGAW